MLQKIKHAKIYNEKYKEENKSDYLMLDFVEIGDEKYRIISLNNVNNLNYAVEISLEVLNKDGV